MHGGQQLVCRYHWPYLQVAGELHARGSGACEERCAIGPPFESQGIRNRDVRCGTERLSPHRHLEIAYRGIGDQRQHEAAHGVHRCHECEANGAARVSQDRIDLRGEEIGARHLANARVDAPANAFPVGNARSGRLREHAVDHLSLDVEGISGDHRIIGQSEGKLALQQLIGWIGEAREQGDSRDGANELHVDVEIGYAQRATCRALIINAIHACD